MKIWQKLSIAFGGTSLLLGTIGILTIKIDEKIQSQTNETVHGIVVEAKAASQIFTSIQLIQESNQDLLIDNEIDLLNYSSLTEYQNQIESELNKLEENIKLAQQTTIAQIEIISSSLHRGEIENKKAKIAEEKAEIANINELIKQVQIYRKEWELFLVSTKQNKQISFTLAKKFTERMNQNIFPLVKEYYEDSLEEITRSELITQRLTSQNITIIKNYVWFSFALSLLLFIYVYRSIYAPIKQLKLATYKLGQNFSEYKPIQPENPHDELGELIRYFNQTIVKLQTQLTSKSDSDNLANSISQSLIIIDLENKITKINYNTSGLLGYSELELVGKPIDYILARSNILKIDELIELDRLSNQCFSLDLITKKSEQIAVTVYFSNLFDEKGQKKGTICLATAVENISLTDRIALQNSKEKANKLA